MRAKRLLLAGGAALLLAVAGVAMMLSGRSADRVQQPPLRAGLYNPAADAPDFALQGTNGSDVRLSQFRGKVVLLTFGFTNCAAVCPTTLATLARTRAQLGSQTEAVQVLFVTVDPARDKVDRLKDYLGAFDRSFVGATGDPEVLAGIRQRYGVVSQKVGDGADYAMAHTSSIFLIDRRGRLRAMMPFGHDAPDFVHDIRYLLAH